MPTINGMKMACEPCIRGHRSTKCTHANERLMVPVRKPGRPLSACPHPRDMECTCNNSYITAAIPRKQACHCGSAHTPPPATPLTRAANPIGAEAPSPTKVTFKVEKQSRSRKQSFDPANFERVDMNNVNVVPFQQRPGSQQGSMLNGYPMTMPQQPYGYTPQYPTPQESMYGQNPFQVPQLPSPPVTRMNGIGLGQTSLNGLSNVPEGAPANMGSQSETGGSCCGSKQPVQGFSQAAPAVPTNAGAMNAAPGSCCGSKQPSHSHNSSSASSVSDLREHRADSSSSSSVPQMSNRESVSSMGTSVSMTQSPEQAQQLPPQFGMSLNSTLYLQYNPQATVFTYPPTYGSFQNPLQPGTWLQNVQNNSYTTSTAPESIPHTSFATPLLPETLDTVHTCSCGDGCSCVGCAAHPYNKQTQDYVRSAWFYEQANGSNDMHTGGHHISNGNGNIGIQTPGIDPLSSPTANTPSSTTSGNGEEQTLSAADFFFVNYPYADLGCAGDEQSCPCGDDCQCLGCEIHSGRPLEEAVH